MTVVELQDNLIQEVKRLAEGIQLMNYKGEPQEIKGFRQDPPILEYKNLNDYPEDGSDILYPFVVVKAAEISYEDDGCQVDMILVFGIRDSDPDQRGYLSLFNLIERVIYRFRKDPVLQDCWCERDMQVSIQEEDNHPYFFGAMEMKWNMPETEQEEMW